MDSGLKAVEKTHTCAEKEEQYDTEGIGKSVDDEIKKSHGNLLNFCTVDDRKSVTHANMDIWAITSCGSD